MKVDSKELGIREHKVLFDSLFIWKERNDFMKIHITFLAHFILEKVALRLSKLHMIY